MRTSALQFGQVGIHGCSLIASPKLVGPELYASILFFRSNRSSASASSSEPTRTSNVPDHVARDGRPGFGTAEGSNMVAMDVRHLDKENQQAEKPVFMRVRW